ncbi:GTP-binding protein Rhes-like isoform X1 [Pomacea canaliculata]|uniref:GTP-binding protein Rhes-like isoform X1 n=1 Tax=Pomacea canaliculata TaxID=400727 RepID=UPI000D7342FE|nr:GTP-binding protein Rhes-like isoform X1 [Pomacea canaliculata]
MYGCVSAMISAMCRDERKVEGGGETLKQTSAPSSLEERNRTCGCLGFTSPLPKMALLEQANNAPPENCFRLVILGSAKVGKTSLVQRFLFNRYDDNYTPTIEDFHRKVYRIRGVPYRLDILDTSGIHPFPAMRRLSFITGDLFVLVFSVDNRESFNEVIRLREQILECKKQCQKVGVPNLLNIPMVIVGNKVDRDAHRVIDPSDVAALLGGQPNCVCVETSAKKNTNVDEVFKQLFTLAHLPAEMSPSMHRKVTPWYEGRSGNQQGGRLVSIRRKMSDACGAVAPNVRRPSIRTDLLMAQSRTTKDDIDQARETRCVIQ